MGFSLEDFLNSMQLKSQVMNELRIVAAHGKAEAASDALTNVPVTNKQRQVANIESAFKAIRDGDMATLTRLVRMPKEANWYREGWSWCLLDEAVRAQSVPMADWLCQRGADPNTLFFSDRRISLNRATKPGMYFSPFVASISSCLDDLMLVMLTHGASLDMPYVIDGGEVSTCRDLAREKGAWPIVESFVIGRSTRNPAQVIATTIKRL